MLRRSPKQPSVMHDFGQVPRADIPRSSFDLSHGVKTTFDADYLIPIGVWDTIPGDSWNVKSTVMARLATPLYPLMDNLYIDLFYFWTPYRILWDNFTKFMGAQDNPTDSIDYTIPVIAGSENFQPGDIADYFGLPAGVSVNPNQVPVSALPFRAYNLVFHTWFRDENLQNQTLPDTDDGPDLDWKNSYSLLKRGKRKDYFTSALPWPQKGDAVDLPLGTSAPVHDPGTEPNGVQVVADADGFNHLMDASTPTLTMGGLGGGDEFTLYADLSNATAATINELRLAFQTQRLLERDARSGTRYVETLKAHWGVTFPDYTAQRPVYLGGGTIPVGMTPVPQTTHEAVPTRENTEGSLAAFGTAAGQAGFTKSFVEHGVIICLANARSDITYSQGVDRYWQKKTRYDFYYPVLSGIGEQSIINSEIWVDGSANDDLIFGYTGRYNEYRFLNSKLTGLMRPDAPATLAAWNLSEDFATLPALGDTFIQSNTGDPLDRAVAVPTEPHFIADIYHDIKAARPLPLYGVPGGIDHF